MQSDIVKQARQGNLYQDYVKSCPRSYLIQCQVFGFQQIPNTGQYLQDYN